MPTSLLQRPTVPVLSMTMPGARACSGSRPRIRASPELQRDMTPSSSSVDDSEMPAVRSQIFASTARMQPRHTRRRMTLTCQPSAPASVCLSGDADAQSVIASGVEWSRAVSASHIASACFASSGERSRSRYHAGSHTPAPTSASAHVAG
jgi:hypothetical protein